jgi:hypothetical protein
MKKQVAVKHRTHASNPLQFASLVRVAIIFTLDKCSEYSQYCGALQVNETLGTLLLTSLSDRPSDVEITSSKSIG